MGKFAGAPVRKPEALGDSTGRAVTHEGGIGYATDARSELYRLATGSFMGGEKSFYETGGSRDSRLAGLARAVVAEPGGLEWTERFVRYLRQDAFMRTAPLMIAAEAANAYLAARSPQEGASVRRTVAAALGRPDELAEFIGYWQHRFGRTLPGGVQRGVADAVTAIVNSPYVALKYDGGRAGMPLGAVIETVHPTPRDADQRALFAFLVERVHTWNTDSMKASLPMAEAARRLAKMSRTERLELLKNRPAAWDAFADAGFTWEDVASWVGRKMTGEEWGLMAPKMGYMALLRNLRNFDEAGMSDLDASRVCARLADPEYVRRSKILPFRLVTAQGHLGTYRWAAALEAALENSLDNVPSLRGRTFVLVDTSGSMQDGLSRYAKMTYSDAAAVIAAAVARNGEHVELGHFASTAARVGTVNRSTSIMRQTEAIKRLNGTCGHGTSIETGIRLIDKSYDQIVIITDGQDRHGIGTYDVGSANVYFFDLAGYKTVIEEPSPGRYHLSGLSDSAFRMMSMISSGRNQNWPF